MSGINFGLDYDGTVTNAPYEFLRFVKDLRASGNKVYIVTMRYPSETDTILKAFKNNVDGIIATSREAKAPFLEKLGIKIHIWIDDNPRAINESAVQIWGHASPEGSVIDPIYGADTSDYADLNVDEETTSA